MLTRLAIGALGLVFLLLGIVGVLLPMAPFGLFFLMLAALCLVPLSERVAGWVRALRSRFGSLDRGMTRLAARLPVPYRRILDLTNPFAR